jgi:phenylacetic acid degradation protein paaN
MSWQELQERHEGTLAQALEAVRQRSFFAHWVEVPSGKFYGEQAHEAGQARFESLRNRSFEELLQQRSEGWVGEEFSPYGFELGISYPRLEVAQAVAQAQAAQQQWRRIPVRARAAILLEVLQDAAQEFFSIAYATMHTTGQGFVMAFQASGPHAFDRALEAVATGVLALESFAPEALWVKPIGKGEVRLRKRFLPVPKGIGAVIGCSTFPLWNSMPGIFANLITGNACIVKPHPAVILPLALFVARAQRVFERLGLNPHLLTLLPCTAEQPLTLELAEHPEVRIVDYTGSPEFGTELERRLAGKVVFTEKAGVNCVLVHSLSQPESMLENLAFSLCLYSGQMCTAPQNILVPATGVETPQGRWSAEEFAERLRAAIDALVSNEKLGPPTLGAIQNERTLERVRQARALGLPIVRDSAPIAQPGFPNARTATPLVLWAEAPRDAQIYGREWFGPISFLVRVPDVEAGITEIARLVRTAGALVCSLYCSEEALQQRALQELAESGVPVALNFTGPVWINQSAAYSDFHGTGLTPAGTASFTDLAYVSARFGIVGIREVL